MWEAKIDETPQKREKKDVDASVLETAAAHFFTSSVRVASFCFSELPPNRDQRSGIGLDTGSVFKNGLLTRTGTRVALQRPVGAVSHRFLVSET